LLVTGLVKSYLTYRKVPLKSLSKLATLIG
jgi:hypothetical protein